jgi:DMSO/TMAO reductase YedYZ heme-binding membrane subunit
MLRNNRFYVLLASGIFSLGVYWWVIATVSQGSSQINSFTQIYSLTSVALLYLSLLAGPLCFTLPHLPFGKQYLHARRALGVAAFYFALLHASFAFFGELGGFEGLAYLGNTYLIDVTLGFLALIILYLLAITSFDFVIQNLTFPRWKRLHRFIYVAGFFILVHALMLGSHFSTLSDFIPQIFFCALAILLFLEALRIDSFLEKHYKHLPRFGISTSLCIGLIVCFYLYSLLPSTSASPLSMHSQHTQMANDSQRAGNMNMNLDTNMSQYPGMDGDKTKRYTTSFTPPDSVQAQEDTTMHFTMYDASSGNRVVYFKNVYDKPAHLVIVDSTLTYFNHIHPTATQDGFDVTTQFPKEGEYHMYLSFQPFGAIEQQVAFTITVGAGSESTRSTQVPDSKLTKTFGDYQTTLDTIPPYKADELSSGLQRMQFTVKESNGRAATLKPYLASFGHLVMINQKTYEYVHVHPTNLKPPKPNENGGPEVEFMPLGLYGPIKPGIYRVFAQFNPDNNLFTADYTVEIK